MITSLCINAKIYSGLSEYIFISLCVPVDNANNKTFFTFPGQQQS